MIEFLKICHKQISKIHEFILVKSAKFCYKEKMFTIEIEDGRKAPYKPSLYINLACLSVCLSVSLYPINVKTAELIGPTIVSFYRKQKQKIKCLQNVRL